MSEPRPPHDTEPGAGPAPEPPEEQSGPAGSRRITDLDTLKAFSHPLRMRLYRALYIARTATASQLAAQEGQAVSLVSYHLRKLAAHGLIEEAPPEHRDGRERWWRPSSKGVSLRYRDFDDAPEKAAVHATFTRVLHEQRGELYRDYLDHAAEWSPEWRDAASDSELTARLTPGELTALNAEILDLLRSYDARAAAREDTQDPPDDRRTVMVQVNAFPLRAPGEGT
ncbi:helix-turn-helix domain-containing protein [Streptomyces sp. NPDC050560]|uniref:helix-turn-helix domain-containing protein n=1 Tax=Streptomyces sp. NPDC050560 TaxID=3365630 RepID=UPI00378DF50E